MGTSSLVHSPTGKRGEGSVCPLGRGGLRRLETPVVRLALLRDSSSGEVPERTRAPVLSIGSDEDHDAIRHYQAGADVVFPSRRHRFWSPVH